VAGVAGAFVYDRVQARSAGPTMDDLMPGYSQARARQVGILIGSLGVTLLGWLDALKEPRLQAELMAGASVGVGVVCFRLASLVDAHERETRERARHRELP